MPHVLLIEDERNLARLLKGHLEEDGYQVTLAFDGPTGLQEAQRLAPDVIVLAMRFAMPLTQCQWMAKWITTAAIISAPNQVCRSSHVCRLKRIVMP